MNVTGVESISPELASLFTSATAQMGCGPLLVTAKSSLVPSHITVTLGLALGQLTLRTLLGTQDNPDASVPLWDSRKLGRAIHSHLSLPWHSWAHEKHSTAPALLSTISSIYSLLWGFLKFICQDRLDSQTLGPCLFLRVYLEKKTQVSSGMLFPNLSFISVMEHSQCPIRGRDQGTDPFPRELLPT